jgi:hypothetical protein
MKMMNDLKILSREELWGPFLVGCGLAIFYIASLRNDETGPTRTVVLAGGVFLLVAGVLLMFRQMSPSTRSRESLSDHGGADADYVVRQLSRNYEILRAQTNQGFLLSGLFMGVGLLVIIASVFSKSLGISISNNSLGTIAGIITEFISGSALLLYRLNFKRLNETSDNLNAAWRVLAAFKLTRELPEGEKAKATMHLIDALTITDKYAVQVSKE